MGQTKIEWCQKVWNPITGCSPISDGCRNCYAKRMANRLRGRYGYPKDDPFRVTFHPDRINEPTRWKKPARIFVCSMGDIAHDEVDYYWFIDIMKTIHNNPHHIFIMLTKRPQNLKKLLKSWNLDDYKNLFFLKSLGDCLILPKNKKRLIDGREYNEIPKSFGMKER